MGFSSWIYISPTAPHAFVFTSLGSDPHTHTRSGRSILAEEKPVHSSGAGHGGGTLPGCAAPGWPRVSFLQGEMFAAGVRQHSWESCSPSAVRKELFSSLSAEQEVPESSTTLEGGTCGVSSSWSSVLLIL